MNESKIKLGVLLNSEGPLIEVYSNGDGFLIITAYSNSYEGSLSFHIRFRDFISYIESKITLRELITLSSSRIFSFNKDVELKRIPLNKVIDSLPYTDKYFNQVSESLK